MTKKINYFFQAILIYLFFLIGRILGITISRKVFSVLFSFLGPLFKSKKIIVKNIRIFSQNISELKQNEIISKMWKNYGMTFIEYIFLDYFHKEKSHIIFDGEDELHKLKKKQKSAIFISGHFANF